jgi:hypothetical protein
LFCSSEFDPMIPYGEVNVNNTANNKSLQIDGIDTAELATYPSLEQSNTAVSTAGKNSAKNSLLTDFTRENDFQHLLPNLLELDWNDPLNDYLLYLKSKKLSSITGGDYFRFFGHDYSLYFHSLLYRDAMKNLNDDGSLKLFNELNGRSVTLMNYSRLKVNSRLQLLQLRAKKPFLFYNLSIPLNAEKIKENEQLKSILQQEIVTPQTQAMKNIDPHSTAPELTENQLLGKENVNLMKATNFLSRVRNSYTVSNRRMIKKKLKTSSVVLEINFIPNLQFIPMLLSHLFETRRELKPKRKERAPEIAIINACDLLVQVIGAKNIPLRIEFNPFGNEPSSSSGFGGNLRDSARFSSARGNVISFPPRQGSASLLSGGPSSPGLPLGQQPHQDRGSTLPQNARLSLNEYKLREKKRVHSFIEIKFQDNIIATTTFEGTTPMWKESLSLPFLPPKNDFSPIGLDQLREEIYFTLFDEIIEDDRERGGFMEGESTVRVERYYLGSFSIPFNCLYHEKKIEGIFRLDTPLINFGYEKRVTKHNLQPGTGGTTGNQGGGLPRVNSSQGSLNGLLTTSQDDAELDARERGLTGPNSPLGGEGSGIGDGSGGGPEDHIPTNRVISATQGFFALISLLFYYCLDCCPNFKDIFLKVYDFLSIPFQSTPFSGYYNNLYLKSNYVSPQTQMELSSYASDDSTTYLKIMLTFDPVLPVTRDNNDEVSPSTVIPDDRLLAIHASKWLDSIRELNEWTAERPYKLFAMNSSGLQVFICRYLTSQKPPEGFQTRRGAIHLVSMIPFVKDIQSFIGAMDLWCTNQQFWEIGAGDEEEHAIMLYNYFRYFKNMDSNDNNTNNVRGSHPNYSRSNLWNQFTSGRFLTSGSSTRSPVSGYSYPAEDFIRNESVFLVMGKAFPEGDTIYLVVRDWNRLYNLNDMASEANYYSAENYLIINPWTGHIYSAIDPYCPLKNIYSLVTPYNLWVNIQPTDAPNAIDYNILNYSKWRSFFNTHFPPPTNGLPTIQQDIDYQMTDESYCKTIEGTVFQAIRNSLRRWRSKRQRSTTTFHPEASNIMNELLPKLEEWKKNGDYKPDSRARVMSRDNVISPTGGTGTGGGAVNSHGLSPGLELLQEEIRKRLQPILRTRILRGFPINIPFTDVDEILTQVFFLFLFLLFCSI